MAPAVGRRRVFRSAIKHLPLISRLYHRVRGGVLAHKVPARWVRVRPFDPGDRACIFVLVARGGVLQPHSVDHALAWHAEGYRLAIVVVTDELDRTIDLSPIDCADTVVVRLNRGYDFGAWAAVVRRMNDTLRLCQIVVTANDSVLGPSDRFATMVQRMHASEADIVGLVTSLAVQVHFQSFVLGFNYQALQSAAFRRFWRAVRSGARQYVIDTYEVPLLTSFRAAGLRTDILFDLEDGSIDNPTLVGWRRLLALDFPYLKIQLLRDNPFAMPLHGWRGTAAAAGFNLDRLDNQLAALGISA